MKPPTPWVCYGLVRGRTFFWEDLFRRITVAGGLYPVAVIAIWGVAAFLWRIPSIFSNATVGGVAAAVAFLVVAFLIYFLMGLLWCGTVSIVVVPACALATRLFDWPGHHDTAGKLTGGLVGYLATLPVALVASYGAAKHLNFLPALFVFAHCGLAIAMGQAAGCLTAVADLRRRRRGKLAASSLRFGVWQLLALTVPVAVVLSILKAADLLNPPMALASIAAAFCAVATWQPVTWLVNRWLDRRLAKRRRRRLADCSTWNNSPS
jgi:hypothetical protein